MKPWTLAFSACWIACLSFSGCREQTGLPLLIASTPALSSSSTTPRPSAKPDATSVPASRPLFALPSQKPGLSGAALALILDGETGGEREYNRNPHPEWPGGQSGVTWGVGYDATAQTENLILEDWRALGEEGKALASTHPYHGSAAKARLAAVKHILVSWDLSVGVFQDVDLVRNWQQARRAFPGFESLRANAQGAILSLGFNRGWAMTGPNRVEMRAIRNDIASRDYDDMAAQERKMERLWRGTDIAAGMVNRREAEARLFTTP